MRISDWSSDVCSSDLQVQATVSGIRSVDWDSMQVNFFAVLSPAALQDMPQSWITSFHLPPSQAALPRELLRQFPNLKVFDVVSILNQLQAILAKVITAVTEIGRRLCRSRGS